MAVVKNTILESPLTSFQGNIGSNSPSSPAYLPGYLLGGRSSPPLGSHGKQLTPGQLPMGQYTVPSPRILFADKRMQTTPSQTISPMLHQGAREKQNAPPVEGLYDQSQPIAIGPHGCSPWGSSRVPLQSSVQHTSTTIETPALSHMETSPVSQVFSPRPNALLQSPAQLDPFYTQGEALKTSDVLDDTWITVFGFPPTAASYILQQFAQYGTINQHEIPQDGNWMHIQYQTKLQARKALSKNGKVFAGKIMIGVRQCIEKELISGANSSIPMTPTTPMTSRVASPIATPKSGSMRPLTAAYKAATENLQVVQDGKGTPQRNSSVVSKAFEYVFGW